LRRNIISASALLFTLLLGASSVAPSYLFVWAGDADGKASDFLGVIDANPSSSHYVEIVASVPTDAPPGHPHHTEPEMPANGHLLANGFSAGRTWLFDLTQPLKPRIVTSFGALAGFSHPHTYIRLADGTVLTTFQYRAGNDVQMSHGPMHTMPHDTAHAMSHDSTQAASQSTGNTTGGLVLMDERGTVIRSGAATDSAIPDKYIYPYAVLPVPSLDLAISTTTDMDEKNKPATSEWVQFWKLSNLQLLRTIKLEAGPRGDENRFTGEPRLLPDGKSVYIHTFNCGLYLIRNIDQPKPVAKFVTAFQGINCGIPILAGHYWLQTVPEAHALISYDITDPEHPREVSRAVFGDDEGPHWIAMDPDGRRVVLNSAGGKGNRLYIVNFDPASGSISIDDKFRDAGSNRPGVSLTGKKWPHGFTGTATPHGTVFSR
jgi:hypothetical protein